MDSPYEMLAIRVLDSISWRIMASYEDGRILVRTFDHRDASLAPDTIMMIVCSLCQERDQDQHQPFSNLALLTFDLICLDILVT
jgi:hypothetical protein